jgi:hypothetical protein
VQGPIDAFLGNTHLAAMMSQHKDLAATVEGLVRTLDTALMRVGRLGLSAVHLPDTVCGAHAFQLWPVAVHACRNTHPDAVVSQCKGLVAVPNAPWSCMWQRPTPCSQGKITCCLLLLWLLLLWASSCLCQSLLSVNLVGCNGA